MRNRPSLGLRERLFVGALAATAICLSAIAIYRGVTDPASVDAEQWLFAIVFGVFGLGLAHHWLRR